MAKTVISIIVKTIINSILLAMSFIIALGVVGGICYLRELWSRTAPFFMAW